MELMVRKAKQFFGESSAYMFSQQSVRRGWLAYLTTRFNRFGSLN